MNKIIPVALMALALSACQPAGTDPYAPDAATNPKDGTRMDPYPDGLADRTADHNAAVAKAQAELEAAKQRCEGVAMGQRQSCSAEAEAAYQKALDASSGH